MASEDQPHLVQALYSFKGRNNDELCFKKGDIITVTQTEEGGWWEGTFGEKTAWFPSNYVKEYKPNSDSLSLSKSQSTDWAAKQKAYRSFVLKDLIESEKAHVNELQGLYHNFLLPIEKAEIMKKSEYQQLVGNLTEVLEVHSSLLDSLREAATQPPSEQRVGRVFLTTAPQLKHILITYCASHPRAVCVLERYKQELSSLMEAHGAVSPGLLVLTAGLSKPFRRLDKYAGMLQEMERHVDESHPDRGDTQRSVAVYKDIASSCSVVRRQKEMEVEVLSGGVRGWEGAEELSALGDILHMGSVAVAPDHQDRYLVLFPSTLLVLSVSHRMSAFIYEGKLPLTGINVNKLEETENCKNSFEIVGPMIERIVAVCQTKEDQQTWIDLLRQQIRAVRGGGLATSPTLRQPLVPTSPSANSVSAANTQSRSHNKNNSTQRTLVSSLDNKFGSVVEKNLNHQDILRQTRLDNYSSPRLASPYARLAAYFARLVRRGVLTRKIVRRLLYRQFAVEGLVDTSAVRRRRSHRTECVIYPQKAVRTWLQEESDDEEEEEEMRGGSEVEDGEGSIESSGFKYVKGGVYRSTLTVMKVGVPDLSRMDSRTAISNQLTVENQGVVAFERQSMPSPTLRDRPLPPVHSVSLDLPPPPVRGAEIITPSSASSTSSVSTFPHRGMSHRSSDSGLADVTTPTSHHVVEECSSYETPCVCCGKGYTAPVVTVTDSESERDRCGFSDVIMERVNCPCNEESLVRDVCDDVIKHFSGENRSHFKCTCNDDSMKSICDDVINHFSSENCSVDGVNHIKCHCEGDPQHIIDDNCPLIDDAVRKKCICKGASNHEFDKNCRVNDVAKTKCYCKGVRNHDLEKNCAFNNVVIKQKCSEGDDTGKKCYYDDITTLYPPDNSITMYNLLDDVRYHSVEEEVATIECPRNFGDNYCPHGDLTTSVEYPCTVPEDVSNDADSSDVTDEQSVPLTYRSGMYAHWWLKKRVPIADVPTANVPSGQRMRQRSHTGDRGFEEDAQILRVIEGYCMSAKSRYTINSVDLSRLAVTSSASSHSPHSHSSPSTPLHRIASAGDDVISGSQLFASTVAACDRCRKSRRASTWCCGHFVLRTLTKAHFQ